MTTLHKDWITNGLVDFEYKKYKLLAYLQEVKSNFDALRLYPFLGDLAFHYKNLLILKENKNLIYENFPKTISKADFRRLKIHYKKVIEDNQLMEIIEEILTFAVPQMRAALEEGKNIYETIEDHLTIETIGISPLYVDEGYLFINEQYGKETNIYQYQISVFKNATEKFRGIHTKFLERVRRNLGSSFEQLKLNLIKKNKALPNPATFLINVEIKCPHDATVLPIAKRMLMRHINDAA
ncbi:hypothetical protein QQ008_28165 [Fulvivirgaceae bacterium BMA10]|uniref:Uncharacterized protein n=1 Tax=Splendidivirga corallicola TaxID=3051826 RepID=A0ABT8KZE5_9BACT|nr:hypothetical protein [Fulvivirgaceae bacterium BMA10]